MIVTERGLEYYVILARELDYFDIIPDIEKATRTRVRLDHMDKRKLRLIRMKDTDERLLESDYYLRQKNTWFSDDHYGCFKKITEPVIKLTPEEEALINYVKTHFEVQDEGWFDISRTKFEYW